MARKCRAFAAGLAGCRRANPNDEQACAKLADRLCACYAEGSAALIMGLHAQGIVQCMTLACGCTCRPRQGRGCRAQALLHFTVYQW